MGALFAFVSEELKVSSFNHIIFSSSKPLLQYFMFWAGKNITGCLALRSDHLLNGPVLASVGCSGTKSLFSTSVSLGSIP